jgi:hypothetical protein
MGGVPGPCSQLSCLHSLPPRRRTARRRHAKERWSLHKTHCANTTRRIMEVRFGGQPRHHTSCAERVASTPHAPTLSEHHQHSISPNGRLGAPSACDIPPTRTDQRNSHAQLLRLVGHDGRHGEEERRTGGWIMQTLPSSRGWRGDKRAHPSHRDHTVSDAASRHDVGAAARVRQRRRVGAVALRRSARVRVVAVDIKRAARIEHAAPSATGCLISACGRR